MPLILGANSLTGGYEIDNSLRFNSGSSDYLNRTLGTATNRKIWTWSGWVKRSALTSRTTLFSASVDGNNESTFWLNSNDNLTIQEYISASNIDLQTTQLFRDVSAWYHIVIAYDSTQATSTNRIRVYVNGTEVTSFSTSVYPSLNYETRINNNVAHEIGRTSSDYTNFFNGYQSEIYFIDGQQLAPSDFGEFDEDTGIWKPIAYTGTYGTNGFYLEFKDSSALGDDTSGNSNDFTVNNLTSIDQTTDTPTNNFATWSPLFGGNAQYATFSEGNLKLDGNNASNAGTNLNSTIGASSGKYYMEVKALDIQGASYPGVGVMMEDDVFVSIGQVGGNPNSVSYRPGGTVITNGSVTSTQDTYTDNDIIGIALDLDNGAVYFAKNGTYQNSGVPTSGASRTGSLYNFTPSSKVYFFGATVYDTTSVISANFGNAPYTIASGNADANGYGNFEYAVPSGYYALNTKNLAEYG
jgi:hypothetical protein